MAGTKQTAEGATRQVQLYSQVYRMPEPRLISCDEAGYTGADLTTAAQPLFSYAAHDLTPDEASALIAEVRSTRRRVIQATELKATGLRDRGDWPEIVDLLLTRLEGRYAFLVFDKRLALAGKAFEYLLEPVLERNSMLFYRHGLHRVVASAVHRTIENAEGPAEKVAGELEAFMRSFDQGSAPTIFASDATLPADAQVLADVLRFAKGYQSRIRENTSELRENHDMAKWVLDLTSTAVMSLLTRHFGAKYPQVDVLCDDSKPLLAIRPFFDNFIDRPETFPIHGGTRVVQARLNLARSIQFGSSKTHPTIQVADLIAGMAAEGYGPKPSAALQAQRGRLDRHLHDDHILPETSGAAQMDPALIVANRAVLRHLAARAELKQDPLKRMEKIYARELKKASSPLRSRRLQR